ncbi:MAG TPA: hypothetical protein VN655_10960 [Pseudolabrys sp.]|nr:hypothetical protein [Pseudolabrys sp.]
MIKQTRAAFAAFTILLVGTTALIATSGVAAARSEHADHKDRKMHKDREGGREAHKQSHHRRKHKKRVIVCITAPCPGDRDAARRRAAEDKLKKEKCGTLILPTAGCPTPARDPVGNTRPTLPERTKQPVTEGRKPVIEYIR